MKIKLLVAGLLLLVTGLFSVPVQAFGGHVEFCFENDGQKKTTYMLYWIDHALRDKFPRPMNLAGGELEIGETHCLGEIYHTGKYINLWYDLTADFFYRTKGRIESRFKITKDNVKVTLKRSQREPIIEETRDED